MKPSYFQDIILYCSMYDCCICFFVSFRYLFVSFPSFHCLFGNQTGPFISKGMLLVSSILKYYFIILDKLARKLVMISYKNMQVKYHALSHINLHDFTLNFMQDFIDFVTSCENLQVHACTCKFTRELASACVNSCKFIARSSTSDCNQNVDKLLTFT